MEEGAGGEGWLDEEGRGATLAVGQLQLGLGFAWEGAGAVDAEAAGAVEAEAAGAVEVEAAGAVEGFTVPPLVKQYCPWEFFENFVGDGQSLCRSETFPLEGVDQSSSKRPPVSPELGFKHQKN